MIDVQMSLDEARALRAAALGRMKHMEGDFRHDEDRVVLELAVNSLDGALKRAEILSRR